MIGSLDYAENQIALATSLLINFKRFSSDYKAKITRFKE